MSTITSLTGLQGRKQERERAQALRDRPKANWFKISSGEVLTVRFLQELDAGSEYYNKDFGTFLGAVERQAPGPKGYLSRALDTTETDPEGRDFAEEMRRRTGEADWRKRENFYINVAVDRGDGKPTVEILTRSMHSPFVEDLIEFYEENEPNNITADTYAIKRTGSGPTTAWKIKKVTDPEKQIDVSGLTPWPLEEYAVRHIPYEQQKEYYMKNYQPEDGVEPQGESSEKPVSTAAQHAELDW